MTLKAVNEHEWSETLPGFAHISRTWDSAHSLSSAKILPGEYYVTTSDEIINTVLGSCISACIRDPDTGVGGMNHFMLPGDSRKSHDKWAGQDCLTTRYGVAAMEKLINEILKQGARKPRLEVKLFGGGAVLKMSANDVGRYNIDFVKNFVRVEGLSVAAEDLGGPFPRKVIYFPRTGKVMIRRLRSLQKKTIEDQERRYECTLGKQETVGEIELFD